MSLLLMAPLLLAALLSLAAAKHEESLQSHIQLRVSRSTKQQYARFQVENCLRPENYSSHDVVLDIEYLDWEERSFYENLRSTLLPETAEGDFAHIRDRELANAIGIRAFDTGIDSRCIKQDMQVSEERKIKDEKVWNLKKADHDNFYDTLLNLILPDHVGIDNERKALLNSTFALFSDTE